MNQLYDQVFPGIVADNREQEEHFRRKMIMYGWVEPEHLGGRHFSVDFEATGRELALLSDTRTPRDKMVILVNVCRVIAGSFFEANADNSERQQMTADDLLPLLIVALIRGRPADLPSTIKYIQTYRDPHQLAQSSSAYYFTHIVFQS